MGNGWVGSGNWGEFSSCCKILASFPISNLASMDPIPWLGSTWICASIFTHGGPCRSPRLTPRCRGLPLGKGTNEKGLHNCVPPPFAGRLSKSLLEDLCGDQLLHWQEGKPKDWANNLFNIPLIVYRKRQTFQWDCICTNQICIFIFQVYSSDFIGIEFVIILLFSFNHCSNYFWIE